MSQHDFDITISDANTGVSFRAAVNAALQALASSSSGATAPATPYAFQLWADTATGLLKQRNSGNTAWYILFPLPGATSEIIMIDKLSGDPSGGELATKTVPYVWYNTTDKKMKMWNGVETVLMA